MKFTKFIYIELWKMMRNRKILAFLLVETIVIGISMLNIQNDPPSTIYLSPYMGISLTFRFIYSAMIVSEIFSKDKDRGIFNTYIACGVGEKTIIFGKILCVCIILLLCTCFSLILYTCINWGMQGLSFMDKDYFASVILTIIPLFINALFLFIVDGVLGNAFITIFTAISFVMMSSFIPYSIAKWLYISYSNPITTILYQGRDGVSCMIFTFIVSFVVFLILIYQLFIRKRKSF